MPARLVSKGIGSLAREINSTALIPPGVTMESVDDIGTAVLIAVRAPTAVRTCPNCGGTCHRVHSRYTRGLADLPLSGRPMMVNPSKEGVDRPRDWVVACLAGRGFAVRRQDMRRLLTATRSKMLTLQAAGEVIAQTDISGLVPWRQ